MTIAERARWSARDVLIFDVKGYYDYLPATFITHDLGDLSFLATQYQRVRPDLDSHYGMVPLPNGSVVFKYPIGMSLFYAPWFGLAHGYERLTHQQALGFDGTYQQMVQVGCWVYAMLGLWLLGQFLKHYFSDNIAALAVLAVGLGTNLFYYATHESPMAHGTLFMLNVLLLMFTRRWYAPTARWFDSVGLGLTLGLMVIVRPSEMMMALVPALWGLNSGAALRQRLQWLGGHLRPVLLVVLCVLAVASIQLLFWRIVGGQWFVDSYPNENFNFKEPPHLLDGLFSFRKGWLLYTPMMGLALLGIPLVRRHVPAALPVLCVLVPLYLYITYSWWDWAYGGSFGSRPVISLYPLLSLGLASLFQLMVSRPVRAGALGFVLLCLLVHNIKQVHQYRLGLINCCSMSKEEYAKYFFDLSWPQNQ